MQGPIYGCKEKPTLIKASPLVAAMIISEHNIYLNAVGTYFQTEGTGIQRRCHPI